MMAGTAAPLPCFFRKTTNRESPRKGIGRFTISAHDAQHEPCTLRVGLF